MVFHALKNLTTNFHALEILKMDFRAYATSEASVNFVEVYDKTYDITSLHFFVNSNF